MRHELEDALLAVDLALVLDALDAPAGSTYDFALAELLADALLAAELSGALAELDRARPAARRATSIARGPRLRGPSVAGHALAVA